MLRLSGGGEKKGREKVVRKKTKARGRKKEKKEGRKRRGEFL